MKTINVQTGNLDAIEGYIARDASISQLPSPKDMLQIKDLYVKALENVAATGVETAYFPSIPKAEPNSTMFQAITVIYKTMKEFQASHNCPSDIRIICSDDDILNLYMVVWNLYYAEDKARRMNDGRWD